MRSGDKPAGGLAVMADRGSPFDSPDYFPTPPWATRALFPLIELYRGMDCWEPAAGGGHMADVLKEFFSTVHESDRWDYGRGYPRGSFVEIAPARPWAMNAPPLVPAIAAPAPNPAWIITNPPFNLALPFAERALRLAEYGVAFLVRTQWLEGVKRYERLFGWRPPTTVAIFAERVPMVKDGWDPEASTATSYCWAIWESKRTTYGTTLKWIPPGRRRELTRPDDAARFAGKKENRDGRPEGAGSQRTGSSDGGDVGAPRRGGDGAAAQKG